MTAEEFEVVVLGEVVKRMRATLACKGLEYATSNDRFHNFRRAGEFLQATPEEALLGMASKPLVTMVDMVHGLPLEGAGQWELEAWWEKVGDAMNYLVLLMGMVIERHAKSAARGDDDCY